MKCLDWLIARQANYAKVEIHPIRAIICMCRVHAQRGKAYHMNTFRIVVIRGFSWFNNTTRVIIEVYSRHTNYRTQKIEFFNLENLLRNDNHRT